jgi:2'-5' RNA ligase
MLQHTGMADDVARLFVALWPDDALRSAIAALRDAWRWPKTAQVVRDERLHLTLHFLGDVERARIAPLVDRLRAVPMEPIELRLERCVRWRNGVASLQPRAVPPALARLHVAVGDALIAVGLTPEARPFRPHVTLARRAFDAEAPSAPFVLDWRASDFVLVESTLRGPRSRYEIVERVAGR